MFVASLVVACAVEQISDPLQPAYSSADLLMRATFTQDSVWDDLGVTEQTYRQQVTQNLILFGWNMVGFHMLRNPLLAYA